MLRLKPVLFLTKVIFQYQNWESRQRNNPNLRLVQQKIKGMLNLKELKYCAVLPEAYVNFALCTKAFQGPQIPLVEMSMILFISHWNTHQVQHKWVYLYLHARISRFMGLGIRYWYGRLHLKTQRAAQKPFISQQHCFPLDNVAFLFSVSVVKSHASPSTLFQKSTFNF